MVAGSVFVEVAPAASSYSVSTASGVETYPIWASGSTTPGQPPVIPVSSASFAWSKLAKFYHYSNCSYVASISPSNLERGPTPPPGKQLHSNCPRQSGGTP
jgi:hypothetical protein